MQNGSGKVTKIIEKMGRMGELTSFLVAVCLSVNLSAAVYVAAEAPESLADGDITFKYDGSGNITELRMRSDLNETLTLTGDPLNLAANAKIIVGQNTNIIENTLSPAGSLTIGITNMSFSCKAVLDTNTNTAFTTMFRNVRLDDIEPISSYSGGISYMGTHYYKPYFVQRSGDTLRAEFQAVDGGYVKGFLLELKQEGDDIVGHVIQCGYFG